MGGETGIVPAIESEAECGTAAVVADHLWVGCNSVVPLVSLSCRVTHLPLAQIGGFGFGKLRAVSTMPSDELLYIVRRKDGVSSKKWPRSKIIEMFEAGKIPISSIVISDTGKVTDIELFAFFPADEDVKPMPKVRRRPATKPKSATTNSPPPVQSVRLISPPLPEPSSQSVEARISGDGITAESVLRFISGLPHRDVAVILPSEKFTLPFSVILSAAQACPPNEIVLDGTRRLAICEMKKKDGWLAVTYKSMFLLAVQHLRISPEELPPPSILQQLYILSNRFLSTDEVGLQYSDLRSIVPQFIEISNAHRHFGSQSRWAQVFVDDPVLELKEALQHWSNDPGFIATHFIGGGFGFKGAVKGMLVAGVLNAFIDAMNESIAEEWQKKLSQPLHMGATKLCVTREMAAFYMRQG